MLEDVEITLSVLRTQRLAIVLTALLAIILSTLPRVHTLTYMSCCDMIRYYTKQQI